MNNAWRTPRIFLFAASLLAAALDAPEIRAQGLETGVEKVRVEARLSVDRAPAGRTFEAALLLDIDAPWHVQAAEPTFDYLIPTQLVLDAPEGITVGKIRYPEPKTIDFAGDRIAVYGGRVPMIFTLSVEPDVPPGPLVLRGELTIQLCDDAVCLAPATMPVEIPFEVVAAGTEVSATHADAFEAWTATEVAVSESSEGEFARLFGQRGLLLTLLAVFLVGLALNLTPCVYPMLSVTVSIFSAQTDTRPGRLFAKAAVYVLGIATMYSVLGTLAALTGGLFGGLMQSPWTLAIIAALLAALALSMFGLYDIRMPSALTNRLGGGGAAAGWAGVYVSGLVVGIFAAPCIGPPIIALLALVGARGDPWFGFGTFFVLALGLGAPYLFLGAFSGLLERLPRSGAWMLWVRKVFGVVLLGVAGFYAALAFEPAALMWAPIATLLAGGLYLGFLERSGNERPNFRRLKRLIGTAALAGGITMLFAEQRQTLMEWVTYHSERLTEAGAAGQPVVIDFYADWCIPCHELERRTFADPTVQRALREHIKLKVDLTRMDSPESEALMREYNVQGVPTVVFLDAAGHERPNTRVLGFLPPEAFLDHAGL